MKSFTTSTFLSLAALLSTTSYAATVTLDTTPCLQDYELDTFTIETDKLVVKDLPTVCGIKITSAEGVDVNALVCQAYQDAEGTRLGSAKFTFANPALIATNPVPEGAIRCDTNGNATVASATTATTISSIVSSGTSVPTGSSGNGTVPTSGTPTQSGTGSETSVPAGTAVGRAGLSAAAIIGAFAVFLL